MLLGKGRGFAGSAEGGASAAINGKGQIIRKRSIRHLKSDFIR
jgi:hypothetical protein